MTGFLSTFLSINGLVVQNLQKETNKRTNPWWFGQINEGERGNVHVLSSFTVPVQFRSGWLVRNIKRVKERREQNKNNHRLSTRSYQRLQTISSSKSCNKWLRFNREKLGRYRLKVKQIMESKSYNVKPKKGKHVRLKKGLRKDMKEKELR